MNASGKELGDRSHRRSREPPPPPPRDYNLEHEEVKHSRDSIRERELEEARARAAQMEKTMRWWSDCTSNWREKWAKVRNERNKAREDNKQLRSKLEGFIKDCAVLKRERTELLDKVELLQKQMSDLNLTDGQPSVVSADTPATLATDAVADEDKVLSLKEKQRLERDEKDRESSSASSHHSEGSQPSAPNRSDSDVKPDLASLQRRLARAEESLGQEQSTSETLRNELDDLRGEMMAMKIRYEDMKQSRQEALEKMNRMTGMESDESQSEPEMKCDSRLDQLRAQLEKLQAENAEEWCRRERIETEKLAVDRENKKLRTEITALQEELGRKAQQAAVLTDIKGLQEDIAAKTTDLIELRQAHVRLQKVSDEQEEELAHAHRRAEQYEHEVKKLRVRVDDLKMNLARNEDECDVQSSNCRRLERLNEELEQQVETLGVQLRHAQSRLRRSSNPLTVTATTTPAEAASDESDDGQ